MPGVGAPERHAVSGFDSQRDHGAGGLPHLVAQPGIAESMVVGDQGVVGAEFGPSGPALRGWSLVLSSDTLWDFRPMFSARSARPRKQASAW